MQNLKMSKQELKEELKETEGNPEVKAKRQQTARQGRSRSGLRSVSLRADVLVLSPSQHAVALRYDPQTSEAPMVVAKGLGEQTLRLQHLAAESAVPVVEDRALGAGFVPGGRSSARDPGCFVHRRCRRARSVSTGEWRRRGGRKGGWEVWEEMETGKEERRNGRKGREGRNGKKKGEGCFKHETRNTNVSNTADISSVPAAREGLGHAGSQALIACGVVGILLVMVVPLPPFALDLLLSTNIAVSLAILLTAFYVERPLDFAVFPGLLLITTLFRLSLNVASTRLILSEAKAGDLIAGVWAVRGGGQLRRRRDHFSRLGPD